ncbi:MAG: magnesium transporter [Candidatus Micrarchaeota archaeon]
MNGSSPAKNRMDVGVPTAGPDDSLAEIEKNVVGSASNFSAIDYIYITDDEGVLLGVISIRALLGARNKLAKARDVMVKGIATARPHTHQERLVYLALRHRIKAVPIVENDGRFLGAVSFESILDIFNEEVREDSFRFGGIFHRVGKEMTAMTSPLPTMIKARLPWLIIGVIGGALTASIVSSFEEVLGRYIMLASFIPVLVYLSDAAGTQSETLIVRGLALDPQLSVRRYLLRELAVAAVLGVICAVLLGAVAAAGWGLAILGPIVGASMFLSLLAAMAISTILPLVFRSLNADPAVASGPLATLLSDMATIVIYFQVATWMLGQFGLL